MSNFLEQKKIFQGLGNLKYWKEEGRNQLFFTVSSTLALRESANVRLSGSFSECPPLDIKQINITYSVTLGIMLLYLHGIVKVLACDYFLANS